MKLLMYIVRYLRNEGDFFIFKEALPMLFLLNNYNIVNKLTLTILNTIKYM